MQRHPWALKTHCCQPTPPPGYLSRTPYKRIPLSDVMCLWMRNHERHLAAAAQELGKANSNAPHGSALELDR